MCEQECRWLTVVGDREICRVETIGDYIRMLRPQTIKIPGPAPAYGYNTVGSPEHIHFEPVMAPIGHGRQHQFIIEIDLCPGISEIGEPGQIKPLFDAQCDKMCRVRRTSRDDGINRMFLQVIRQKSDGRFDPELACIGNKQVTPQPDCDFIGKARLFAFAQEAGTDLVIFFKAYEFAVKGVRLPYGLVYDLQSFRNIFKQ